MINKRIYTLFMISFFNLAYANFSIVAVDPVLGEIGGTGAICEFLKSKY